MAYNSHVDVVWLVLLAQEFYIQNYKRAHGSTANFHYKWKNGEKKLFNSFEISKNIISKFSGLLIGQNDSLDVLLMDDFSSKKGRNDLTHTFGC